MAKLVGLAKELAVAAYYGADVVNDAYALSFTLVNWPVAVWTSIVTSLFVPYLASQVDGDAEKSLLIRQALGLSVIVGAAGMAALIGTAMFFPGWLARGREALGDELIWMLGTLALTIPLGMVAALQAAWLMAHHRHVNSLLDGAPSLILLIVIVSGTFGSGGAALAWGTVLGFAVQVAALRLLGRGPVMSLRPSFAFNSVHWTALGPGLRSLALSQGLLAASVVVDQMMVTGLGESANSVLGYANRILLLALTLVSTALSRALLPVLSHVRDDDERRCVARRWAVGLFIAGVIVALVAAAFAEPVTAFLFQRGAFGPDQTRGVAEALRFGVLQIPPFAAGVAIAQYVSSGRRYGSFVLINAVLIGVKIIGNLILVPSLGIPGVMASTAVMYVVSAFGLAWAGGLLNRDK